MTDEKQAVQGSGLFFCIKPETKGNVAAGREVWRVHYVGEND